MFLLPSVSFKKEIFRGRLYKKAVIKVNYLLYKFWDLFIKMSLRNNRTEFNSHSQSATRTMKFHLWNNIVRASDWTNDVFLPVKNDRSGKYVRFPPQTFWRESYFNLKIEMAARFTDAGSVDNFISEQENKASSHKNRTRCKTITH